VVEVIVVVERFAVSEADHPFEFVIIVAAFPVRGSPAISSDKFAVSVY
jgi:hypothetical protein